MIEGKLPVKVNAQPFEVGPALIVFNEELACRDRGIALVVFAFPAEMNLFVS